MKNKVVLTEDELKNLIKKIVLEHNRNIDEGIFDPITHSWRNLKGFFRGWGKSTFRELSKLEKLMENLTKLDKQKNITAQLSDIKSRINSYGLPPDRIEFMVNLVDKGLEAFSLHQEILNRISEINLDSWSGADAAKTDTKIEGSTN
jgi:hypothetical protein